MRLTLGVILLLAGCASAPPPKVETITVTVEKLVPVPEDLTRSCDIHKKQNDTYGELKRLRGVDLASLRECSGRMEKIRKLGEK